jgi:alkyl hydroperoxide reductase subunit D
MAMNIEQLKNSIPDFAKDIKLNFGSVLTQEGAPDLTQKQIFYVALGVAYALKNQLLIEAILADTKDIFSEADIQAAKAAAIIMAMNNIYYRFLHLTNDKSYASMPAKLRMSVIGSPGIDKLDFELISLAISALNGCGMCVDAHINELTKSGISKLGIQSSIRIASVLNAVVAAITIQN